MFYKPSDVFYEPSYIVLSYFDEENIRANANAYMSKMQREYLSNFRKLIQESSTWGLLITAALSSLSFMFIHASDKDIQLSEVIPTLVGIALFWLILGLIYIFIYYKLIRPLNEDLHKGEIALIEGEIKIKQHIRWFANTSPNHYYSLNIKNLKFIFGENDGKILQERIIDGQVYSIYYAPYSKNLLSLAVIPSENI